MQPRAPRKASERTPRRPATTAEKDYESFKDDQSIGGSYVGGAGAHADFERDSERPPNY